MNGKTEYGNYNIDDFVEVDGQLKELTVTITLCEYRNLVKESIRQEKTFDDVYSHLQEEIDRNKALRTENEALKTHVDELQHTNEKLRAEINNLQFDLRMKKTETRCAAVESNEQESHPKP